MLYWWKELFPYPFIMSDKDKSLSLEGVEAVGLKVGTWKCMHVVRARRGEGTVKDVKWSPL